MQLSKLLYTLSYKTLGAWNAQQDVAQLTADSRQASAQSVFVAIRGAHSDGHSYINKAIEQGCQIVVCEEVGEANANVLYIVVPSTSYALGIMAANWHGNPSRDMKVVGTTGTNGKTTTTTLLYKLFSQLGYMVGLISTVEYRIGNQVFASTHTTPDALNLQRLFAQMRDAGCEYVFMEVSSHAAHQHRIAGTQFAGAIFTNITHDHLDYHGTFQHYINAKKMFFDMLPKTAFALVNIDDKRGEVMLQNCAATHHSYALRTPATFKAKILENNLTGLVLDINEQELYARLVGDFNAYNLLAVYGAATLLGVDNMEVLRILSNLESVDGRFETIANPATQHMGIVDYAHTPDALEKVLQTLDRVRQGDKRIITVVGCGGDRDKTKRPIMAKIACAYSQVVILTSDNPRTEQPAQILADMNEGVAITDRNKVQIIEERRQAIQLACQLAEAGDVILVAGKGHEKYQEIDGIKYPFDDKAVLQEAFAALANV